MNRKEVRDAILQRIKDAGYPTLLILVQGAAGSGKTTFANSLADIIEETRPRLQNEPLTYCPAPYEADKFFEDPFSGEYKYNRTFVKYAHMLCTAETAKSLMNGCCAIVSNTSTSAWDMDKYYELAKDAGVDVILVRMLTEYGNVHNCPQEVVERHKRQLANEKTHKPDYIVDEPLDTDEWQYNKL